MSSLKLPVLAEEKKPEIKIPEIPTEPIAPEIQQDEIFIEKKPDTIVNIAQMDIKPVKPKRKLSEKQIAHLAKMRENRLAKRKAKQDNQPTQVNDPRSPTIAPRKDGPTKKAEAPANTPKPDNFYQFMDYMEKYKSIKKSWRERDSEKRQASAPKPPPVKTSIGQVVPQKTKPPPIKKPSVNVLNIKKTHNPYSSYF